MPISVVHQQGGVNKTNQDTPHIHLGTQTGLALTLRVELFNKVCFE